MTAFPDDLELRAGDAFGYFPGEVGRSDLVGIADDNEGGTAERRQIGTRIGATQVAVCWRTKASTPASSAIESTMGRNPLSSLRDSWTMSGNRKLFTALSPFVLASSISA